MKTPQQRRDADCFIAKTFDFDADFPKPDCSTFTFNNAALSNWYEGNGGYFVQATTLSCYSYGGGTTAGARDDGEVKITVAAVAGSSVATDRLGKYRNLTPPVQLKPDNGTSHNTLTPVLTWTPALNNTDSATLYYRVIIVESVSNQRVFSSWPWLPGITSFQVPPGVLKSGKTYILQVRAYDASSYYDADNYARSYFWDLTVHDITAVPTITQWGMIVMSILLIGSAVLFIRRRRIS